MHHWQEQTKEWTMTMCDLKTKYNDKFYTFLLSNSLNNHLIGYTCEQNLDKLQAELIKTV